MKFLLSWIFTFSVCVSFAKSQNVSVSSVTLNELKSNAGLQECSKKYQAGPNQAGLGPGKVTMKISLAEDGTVVGADQETSLSTIREDFLRQCFVKVFRTLKFPEETKGQKKTVLVPLDLPL
ncbi:hypothetical protein AZI86_13670 [Bdellovibrio bacteriovorus]|uniref:TonB C-terminal domain-containing protein n=1 Tax=Bdellovibrio bacteriovorus TaxID=959 RepID=A0A150WJG8_BDEBC|nr:hypothetical protein [Bdellovibrio bacteriovorus]KYG63862.1 hypothetical protein AZI86_13670 [Bdellovibrio bacteriovorus]